MVVKQFTVDRPEAHSSTDVTPPSPHYCNPFYLRLDLKTRSTRLLHNSIQQTSVDATPEHHANVVSGLAAVGVLPVEAATSPVPSQTSRSDRRSCSIVSAGKKTVAFADTVDVCGDGEENAASVTTTSTGGRLSRRPSVAAAVVAVPVAAGRPRANVLQVHSQTGEVVGDVLIERFRDPSPSPPPPLLTPTSSCVTPTSPTCTPSPGDDDVSTASSCSRRMRHEMFCRRRQSPVYSCDYAELAATPADDETNGNGIGHSASSSSVYESCEDLPVVVLDDAAVRPPLRRPAAAVSGYAGCCPS